MKRLLVVTNTFLAVIAVCLLLIVTKLYDLHLVTPAQAQSSTTVERTVRTAAPLPVQIVNDRVPCTIEGAVDARMHAYDMGWSPVNGKYGALIVKEQE